MKRLTGTEEKIMQILWDLNKAFVRDVIDRLPDPRPPYTTVSSIIRILEKKGFVDHHQYGNTYQYAPKISRHAYRKAMLREFVSDYFDNSYQQVVSFFARDKKLSVDELEEIIRMIQDKK